MKKQIILCLLVLLCIGRGYGQSYYINAFAGNGTLGPSGDGGAATSAGLKGPFCTIKDASGNILIGEVGDIRSVSPSGVITTICGTGTVGFSGIPGPASSASIGAVQGIAKDSYGNIYFSDATNHVVMKIDGSGYLSIVAGTGVAGYNGDLITATTAKLNGPCALLFNSAGHLLIADRANNRIRMLNTSSGIISTFAGDGTTSFIADGNSALSGGLVQPIGLAIDGTGNVYVSLTPLQVVRKINTSGIINTFAGTPGTYGYSGDGGSATSALLNGPGLLCFDGDGNLLIADSYNRVIRKVTSTGIISTFAGTGALGNTGNGGLATAAKFRTPNSIYYDGISFYITDLDGGSQNTRVITLDYAPYFPASGHIPNITVCQNSTGTSIDEPLKVDDFNIGQTLTWTLISGPAHGTISGLPYSTLSTGPTLGQATSGVTYTPVTGYSGSDVITIQVSDGITSITSTANIIVKPIPGAITGTTNTCQGTSSDLNDPIGGGTWSSDNTSIAIVNSTTGLVTGVSPGTVTISYSNGCAPAATTPFTVNALPDPITGTTNVCLGLSTALSSSPSGGTWSSSGSTVAAVDASGNVTGVNAGTATISYTTTCGTATTSFTVIAPPAAITGPASMCMGGTAALTETTTGGTWSSSNTAVAVVDASGNVTSVSPGTTTISYSNGCSPDATKLFTVNANPDPIAGTLVYCNTAGTGNITTGTVTDAIPSGTWSVSGGSGIAITSSGVITTSTGSTTGTVTYTLPSTGCYVTAPVIVSTPTSNSITVEELTPFALRDPGVNAYTYCGSSYPLTINAWSATLPASGVTYAWTAPATGNITTPSAQSSDVSVSATSTFSVSATYGCVYKATAAIVLPSGGCIPCDNFKVSHFNSTVSPLVPGVTSVQPFHTVITTLSPTTGSTSTPVTNNIYVAVGVSFASGTFTDKVIMVNPAIRISIVASPNVTLDHTHIFAPCGGWAGINIRSSTLGGTLELKNGALLEGERVVGGGQTGFSGAVFLNNDGGSTIGIPTSGTPILNSHETIYNDNFNGIGIYKYNVNTPPAVMPIIIKNNIFTNRDFTSFNDGSSSDYSHYYPFSWPAFSDLAQTGTPTSAYDPAYNNLTNGYTPLTLGSNFGGVYITEDQVTGTTTYNNIKIGDDAPGNENIFDHMVYGVRANNSSILVYNNIFTDNTTAGVQVSNNSANGSNLQAVVGDASATGNRFYNCAYAIKDIASTSYTNMYHMIARYNQVYSTLSSANGIRFEATSYDNIDITHNKFYSVTNPVGIGIYNHPVSYVHGSIDANYNDIYYSYPSSGISSVVNQAISIVNGVTSGSGTETGIVTASNNNCYNVKNGIYVNNFSYMPVKITSNTIALKTYTGTQAGIYSLKNLASSASTTSEVSGNTIYGEGYTNTTVNGISMNNDGSTTNSVSVTCNNVHDLGSGFYFDGGATRSYLDWHDNTMTSCKYGMYLNTTIGAQGAASGHMDNYWRYDNTLSPPLYPTQASWSSGSIFQTNITSSTYSSGSTLYTRTYIPQSQPYYTTGTAPTLVAVSYSGDFGCTGQTTTSPKSGAGNTIVDATSTSYTLYPNPTNGIVYIKQQGANSDPVHVKIYNTLGSVVFEDTVNFYGSSAEISSLNVASGIYMVEIINSDNQRTTTRLSVQN